MKSSTRWIGGALLASAIVLCAPARADIRIVEDPGGMIGPYFQSFAMIRESGSRVIIDGPCLSACTLVVGLVPRNRICVTPRAVLGFHAAWVPGADGRPVHSSGGTNAIWAAYPPEIRGWIRANGGLSRKMIYLRGSKLRSMFRACN